ncbi:MAG TPA: hypothetical protein V6C85_22885 [Allocoleopsis sp.]
MTNQQEPGSLPDSPDVKDDTRVNEILSTQKETTAERGGPTAGQEGPPKGQEEPSKGQEEPSKDQGQ